MGLFNFFSRKKTDAEVQTLDRGLTRTKEGLMAKIRRATMGRSTIDDDLLDDLEEILVTSDVGIDTTLRIIDRLSERVKRDKYVNADELNTLLCEETEALLADNQQPDLSGGKKPYVIMVVGVNGVGKTTTIGKLAHKFANEGAKVVLGAADTFRAAAIEQLQTWAERSGADLVRQQQGSDPAAVAFDTLSSAVANGADVVIIDTAGRLHNKKALMDELSKIKRVMDRVVPGAPNEVLLVLDGSTGQNAFEQARQFAAATQITGLAITKLDGTARGGVVIGISDQLQVPVRYIGLGEGIDDLQTFDKNAFVRSLFGLEQK